VREYSLTQDQKAAIQNACRTRTISRVPLDCPTLPSLDARICSHSGYSCDTVNAYVGVRKIPSKTISRRQVVFAFVPALVPACSDGKRRNRTLGLFQGCRSVVRRRLWRSGDTGSPTVEMNKLTDKPLIVTSCTDYWRLHIWSGRFPYERPQVCLCDPCV
jgi:hypothetical protein